MIILKKRHSIGILTLFSALVLATSSATAAGWDDNTWDDGGGGWGDDSWSDDGWSDNSRSGGYDSGWSSDYERGGLALDYFHTDQFFGREVEGFPDTAFGENSDYDVSGFGNDPAYNNEFDSTNQYGAFTDMARHYGEGFVSGEGFGDEYIGDPDQLDEEIFLFG